MSRPSARCVLPLIAFSLCIWMPASADQGYRNEQTKALRARLDGAMPLSKIEQRIVPRMPGCDYLGPEIDGQTGTYRLKFMRGGTLIWLDVDPRTGNVIGRSGD